MLRNRFWGALGSIALALSALMLFRVENAHADVIQQTVDFGPLSAHAPGNGTVGVGTAASVSFSKFDPSQGTLTGVTLTLTSQVTVNVEVDSTVLDNVVASYDADLIVGGANFIGDANGQCSGFIVCNSGVQTSSFNGGPKDLSPVATYIGGGSAIFDLSSTVESFSVSGCTILGPDAPNPTCENAFGTSSWSGSLELDYTYTPAAAPVPEPASLAIFGTALAGLGLLRRRRRHV